MASSTKFVAYYRVSTRKQGASGLGIEAQKAAVSRYAGDRGCKVVAEFVELESGKRNDRPALEQALAFSRVHRAALVVAKVDRLTRSVGFLERLLDAGVDELGSFAQAVWLPCPETQAAVCRRAAAFGTPPNINNARLPFPERVPGGEFRMTFRKDGKIDCCDGTHPRDG